MDAAPAGLVLAAAATLALAHLLAGRLTLHAGHAERPRSAWLSVSAGISVAYVFAHLLPELAAAQEQVSEDGLLPWLEDHAYLLALLGLIVPYAVEHHSQASRRGSGGGATTGDAFWLSIASFAVYNAMIGYLLVQGEAANTREVVLYTVALGVHFVINDHSLRDHHRDAYRRVGRWLLASAVLVGWAVARTAEISERALALVLAFIAGGIVLNVLKEELPAERRGRPSAFVAGAAAYAALLQAF